jgi:hypothetical protein
MSLTALQHNCGAVDQVGARLMAAADRERRRLERDLHDGAQQRLVSLSVRLRLLASRLAPGSEAERLLADARNELAAALEELRNLARGIHPAILSDRGLPAALEALSARAPLPVELLVELDRRPPEPVEVAAYYLVSEALTNILKHSHATTAGVSVARRGTQLVVEVVDDGAGGADRVTGSGLRGLTARIEALGGRLEVSSPAGAGTTLRAQIPLEQGRPKRKGASNDTHSTTQRTTTMTTTTTTSRIVRVLAIGGSLRSDARNRRLLEIAAEMPGGRACGAVGRAQAVGVREGTAAWIDAATKFGRVHNDLTPLTTPNSQPRSRPPASLALPTVTFLRRVAS